jgi:hypothetical protein
VALLESIAAPEARTILESISRDARDAWLAREASDALERLDRKRPAPPIEQLWKDLSAPECGKAAHAFLMLAQKAETERASAQDVDQAIRLVVQLPLFARLDSRQTKSWLPHELLYRKSVLAAFRDEEQDSPLGAGVWRALSALRESDTLTKELPIRNVLLAAREQQLTQIKAQTIGVQKEKLGEALFQILKAAEELEALQPQRAQASKFWQANYDCILARLYGQAACILEYSSMLGQVRGDKLPPINRTRHSGWILVSVEKVSEADAQELAEKARTLLDRLAEENRETPWEVWAHQQANTPLGLRWLPLVSKAGDLAD